LANLIIRKLFSETALEVYHVMLITTHRQFNHSVTELQALLCIYSFMKCTHTFSSSGIEAVPVQNRKCIGSNLGQI